MILIASVIVVSFILNALCNLSEAALYAVPMSRVQRMVEEKVAGAVLLARLKANIEEPISAILTFNTVAGTIGASILGTLVAKEFASGHWMLVVFPPAFALLMLVGSEIIAKTLGVTYAVTLAPLCAYFVRVLVVLAYPFVRFNKMLAKQLRRSGPADESSVSEADLIFQAKMGVEEGSLLPEEAVWITNALRLNEKSARDLMTPRTVVYRLPVELPLSMVVTHSEHWTHSRLPLCRDTDPDTVVGMVYRREVFDALIHKTPAELESMTLKELLHPVEFIPETLPGNQILQRFLKGKQHLFIVANEHGGMEGIVTLEDVLEELLGQEIVDPHDRHPDMQEYARNLAKSKAAR